MERPILKALILLILGICLSRYVDIPIFFLGLIVIINVLICLYNIIKGEINQSLLILFLSLGMFLASYSGDTYLLNRVGSIADVEATIKEIDSNKLILRVSKVDGLSSPKENMLVYHREGEDLKLGMEIAFRGKINMPLENTNPKLHNNRLYLRGKKIYTTSYVENIDIISEDPSIIYRVKNNFISFIEDLLENNFREESGSFLKAIILGRTTYLLDESLNTYRNLGLGHLLAVSGMHIGVISIFLLFIFKTLRVKKPKAYIFTLLIIWIYGFFINFPVSVVRANIMLTLLFYSKISYEPYESLDIVLITMIGLLLINPYYLYQIGFQLSFGALLSILLLAPKIRGSFYPYKNFLTETLAILLAIQVGLFPIQAYYFNQVNLLSIPSNLLVIPIISKLLILTFLFILFHRFFLISSLLKMWIEGLMAFQLLIVKGLGDIDFLKFNILSLDILIIFYYYILILIGFKYISIGKIDKKIVKFIVIYLVFLVAININIYTRDSLKVDFIDVGQGDCILVREAGRTYLIDTGGSAFGNFNIPEAISIPYIKKLGISKIDAFFISHFHEDHSQGFKSILSEFDVDKIYISYIPENHKYKDEIYKNKERVFLLKKGDTLSLSKNLSINVLWPEENMVNYLGENDKSLVLNLKFKEKKILLTGDIEGVSEAIMMDSLEVVDFLKVAHHGSKTSTGIDFLTNTSPSYSIIQVGRENRYGHPNEEVIDLLNSRNVEIYRNDMDGLVSLEIKGQDYEFKTYLENGNIKSYKIGELIYRYRYLISFYTVYYLLIYTLIKSTYVRERKGLIDIY